MSGRGSRKRPLNWFAMDLHAHTPASSDFQEPHVTYLDLLQRAEARGLDMLAFTDHNTVAGHRRLRAEIEELELLERLQRLLPAEKTRLDEYRRLLGKVLLLPGFEFTATFGFHIIGVFAPETPVRDLEHLLLSLNVPHDQLDAGSATVGATSDVLTAYRLIDEAGGVVIAAHANSSNGVAMRGFNFGGQTKIAYTQDPHLHALEVTDLDQKGRRSTAAFFNGTKPEYPRRMHCIQGSDCHRLKRESNTSKNLGLGDRVTDVQLEELSFEALRKLFLSGDFARARPHTGSAHADEFDYVQQARDEGANIIQDFHESMTQRGGRLYAVLSDVCALANTNGGTLYIGVSGEAKQPPVGVANAAQAMKDLNAEIEQKLTPCLSVTVDSLQSKGKTVIRVQVPRGDDLPYALDDNKIYVRQEAETSLAVRDEIVQLVLRRSAPAVPPPARPPRVAPQPEEAGETPAPPPAEIITADAGAPLAEELVARPRTGVEILATEERNGVIYHTMRDLRNGNVVKNVTRASARKLWHYAISQREAGPLDSTAVAWYGDIGLVKKIHKGDAVRYDLVQRVTSGDLRVYYGVTDDGIHGEWKSVVGGDEE
jgi:hypothetical protein